ncbi:MAG TPA: hypothetical protein VMV14_04465 [Acidimicrobiales bacterium]|nr:hypothetical protein [Acidimicrobiales bacterium]
MSELPRVVEVEHLGNLSLRLTFSDGLVRELDFGAMTLDIYAEALETSERRASEALAARLADQEIFGRGGRI